MVEDWESWVKRRRQRPDLFLSQPSEQAVSDALDRIRAVTKVWLPDEETIAQLRRRVTFRDSLADVIQAERGKYLRRGDFVGLLKTVGADRTTSSPIDLLRDVYSVARDAAGYWGAAIDQARRIGKRGVGPPEDEAEKDRRLFQSLEMARKVRDIADGVLSPKKPGERLTKYS